MVHNVSNVPNYTAEEDVTSYVVDSLRLLKILRNIPQCFPEAAISVSLQRLCCPLSNHSLLPHKTAMNFVF